MNTIYTIGHSTRSIEEFVELLRKHDITQLVDVRSIPGSRHNPQYNKEALEKSLPKLGIEYFYEKNLGGYKKKKTDASSTNTAWRNASFRNYADYMQTEAFRDGLMTLIDMAQDKPAAIMCAEAVPWRCHRSLVGDALLVRGIEVIDIMSQTTAKPHSLTSFARVDGTTVTYPGETEG